MDQESLNAQDGRSFPARALWTAASQAEVAMGGCQAISISASLPVAAER